MGNSVATEDLPSWKQFTTYIMGILIVIATLINIGLAFVVRFGPSVYGSGSAGNTFNQQRGPKRNYRVEIVYSD